MQIQLTTQPSSPTIIVGFPGVGLIGPIVTEFLIGHMKTTRIGAFTYDDLPAMAAIHEGKIVHPMSIHYSEKHNTIIVYTILNLKSHEWDVAGAITKLAKDTAAKEIICVDGATSTDEDTIFVFGNPQLAALGAKPMIESVIMGVGGALLLTTENVNCVYASTQMDMPDSKSAADVVKFLDKYLGLEVDYQPLLDQAKQFETKLKSVMSQTQKIASEQDRKNLDYFG